MYFQQHLASPHARVCSRTQERKSKAHSWSFIREIFLAKDCQANTTTIQVWEDQHMRSLIDLESLPWPSLK
jgi:hypothetical protein